MFLLIDDARELGCEVIARTAEAGKKLLPLGPWECVVFDHDLGKGPSGYDVLTWAIENNHLPDHVQLCTINPVGRGYMTKALEAAGFKTKGDGNFYRNPDHVSSPNPRPT
jgi:hypothetical protein